MRQPDGINPKDLLGAAKPPLHLVPPALVLWVSKVFGFSAKKYGPFNWREKAVKLTVYIDAAERHLQALKDGQDVDPETGLPHWAHIGANAAIMLDAAALGKMIDDRTWAKGPAPELIEELTVKAAFKNIVRDPLTSTPLTPHCNICSGVGGAHFSYCGTQAPIPSSAPWPPAGMRLNSHGIAVPRRCQRTLRDCSIETCARCHADKWWDGVVSLGIKAV